MDNLIEQIARIQFEQIKMAPPQELIKERQSREMEIAKAKLNLLNGQYQQKQKDYHGGGSVLFDEENILDWVLEQEKRP